MDEKQERESKHETHSNFYQNSPKNANKNVDSASIKSDEVQHKKSRARYSQKPSNKNTVHYNNPVSLSKPKGANKPTGKKPVAKPHYYLPPNNKALPTEEEYVLPDVKRTADDQYASLAETNRVENQYSSLAVQQDTAYQGLVGQRFLPSEYTIPRTTD